jgi:hypothetical protein
MSITQIVLATVMLAGAFIIYYCRDWKKVAEEAGDLIKIEQDGM